MIVSGHVVMLGHMFGHVTWKVQGDHMMGHVMGHVMGSQGHMPASQGHIGESLFSLFDYNLALGSGWVDLGVSCVIPSEVGWCRRLRLCYPTSRGDQMRNLQVHQVCP